MISFNQHGVIKGKFQGPLLQNVTRQDKTVKKQEVPPINKRGTLNAFLFFFVGHLVVNALDELD